MERPTGEGGGGRERKRRKSEQRNLLILDSTRQRFELYEDSQEAKASSSNIRRRVSHGGRTRTRTATIGSPSFLPPLPAGPPLGTLQQFSSFLEKQRNQEKEEKRRSETDNITTAQIKGKDRDISQSKGESLDPSNRSHIPWTNKQIGRRSGQLFPSAVASSSSSSSSSNEAPSASTSLSDLLLSSSRQPSLPSSSPSQHLLNRRLPPLANPELSRSHNHQTRRDRDQAPSFPRPSFVDMSASDNLEPASHQRDIVRLPRRSETGQSSESRRYLLHILQQPTTGCAFGSNLLSRLAIAPPLIVQLQVIDRAGREVSLDADLPFLICHISLITQDGQNADMLTRVYPKQAAAAEKGSSSINTIEPAPTTKSSSSSSSSTPKPATTTLPVQQQEKQQEKQIAATTALASSSSNKLDEAPTSVRLLYGTLVASPMQLYTPQDRLGNIFIFPEVSIRSRGQFRLQITVTKVQFPPITSTLGAQRSQPVATTTTDPIEVVLSSNYVAPHTTYVTRHFARQGVGLLLPPDQALPSNQIAD